MKERKQFRVAVIGIGPDGRQIADAIAPLPICELAAAVSADRLTQARIHITTHAEHV